MRWLNAGRRAAYAICEKPDASERQKKAIDYVLRDGQTHRELAVEVSTIWRSKDAGKEDDYINKWFEKVRVRGAGRVHGLFYITLPISVPHGLDAVAFGDELVATIRQDETALVRGGPMLALEISGVRVWVSKLSLSGSDIRYARSVPDMSELPERVRSCLDEKAPKLKPYSDRGIETWLVVYNTMWSVLYPSDIVKITTAQCGPAHAHVQHIAVSGPPDWINVVR